MQSLAVTDTLLTDALVGAILDELNEGDAGLQDLDRWAAQSSIKPDRVIVGPDITYVRLAGEAEHGGPVILMHVEHTWERAAPRPLAPRVDDLALHRARRRIAAGTRVREARRAASRG
ncbi:hypothetical protein [Agrococcus jenensis]|uniref:Uncharacterized protein n=1 Tax=Agrococcus jenensis TaxID=46353 RepID=A0A3N2APM7_9MICO|nr:hypothetical protein [Agrococcus jenensis]ROR64994.1 hypothetical protein EDD26_0346 [Agrococcus jenensis]